MNPYRVGQILEEVRLPFDKEQRDPEYFEVIIVYNPPKRVISGMPIYAEIRDAYGNIIQLDELYELFIKPVEVMWD